jgi:hypothetical protein
METSVRHFGSKNLYEIGQFFPQSEVINKSGILINCPYTYRVVNGKIESFSCRVLEKKKFFSFEQDLTVLVKKDLTLEETKEVLFEKNKNYCLRDFTIDNFFNFKLKDTNLYIESMNITLTESTNYNKENESYELYKCLNEKIEKGLISSFNLIKVEEGMCTIM